MTVRDAQTATRTYDCTVPMCTGAATRQGGLCAWHKANGTPDTIITPGATRAYLGQGTPKPRTAKRGRLEQRIAKLNRQIQAARQQRDLLQTQLEQLKETRVV